MASAKVQLAAIACVADRTTTPAVNRLLSTLIFGAYCINLVNAKSGSLIVYVFNVRLGRLAEVLPYGGVSDDYLGDGGGSDVYEGFSIQDFTMEIHDIRILGLYFESFLGTDPVK